MTPYESYSTSLIDVLASQHGEPAMTYLVAYRFAGEGWSATGYLARVEWTETGERVTQSSEYLARTPEECLDMWKALTGRTHPDVTLRHVYEAISRCRHTHEHYLLERA